MSYSDRTGKPITVVDRIIEVEEELDAEELPDECSVDKAFG